MTNHQSEETKTTMKRILKWTVRGLIVLVVIIQFYRPARTNPPIDMKMSIDSSMQLSADVSSILRRSCYDCHSSETVWPWYSNVAPVSWYLVNHVNDGRKELSFSDWGTYKARRKARKLKEICEQLEKDEMPLSTYRPLHPAAKLSEADKNLLCEWAKREEQKMEAGGQ